MAERDRVIKSGQLTLPRILFLALIGGLIVFTVYAGGVFLSIGYWFLTIAICGLLYLIAIDYGIKMDKVSLTSPGVPASVAAEVDSAPTPSLKTTMGEAAGGARAKRRTSRPAKRRR
jgi:hypothetical protein